MVQNTNSASSLRLQPNKSNNIGNIVQEYIRYNRKYEDEKTAREKIEKIREAEFQFKVDGRYDKLLESATITDPKTFWGTKIARIYEKDANFGDLARKAVSGTVEDKNKFNIESKKYKNLGNAISVLEAKIKSNQALRKEGKFNPILDEQAIAVENAFLGGHFNIDPESKNTTLTLADGTDLTYTPEQVVNGEFVNYQYSPPSKLGEYGTAITENVYGKNPNITDEQAKLLSTKSVRDFFSTDKVQRDTWYGTFLKRKGINPRGQDPYEKLPLEKKIEIENAYIKEYVNRPVKTIKEEQAEANLEGKKLSNTSTQLSINKQVREAEIAKKLIENPPPPEENSLPVPTIKNNPKTGEMLKRRGVDLSKGYKYAKENPTTLFDMALPKGGVNYGSTANSKGFKITSIIVDTDGGLRATGYKLKEGEKDEDVIDYNEEVVIGEDDKDLRKIGDIVKLIPNGKSKNSTFNSAYEFSQYALDLFNKKNKQESNKSSNNTSKKTVDQIMKENNISFSEAMKIYNNQ